LSTLAFNETSGPDHSRAKSPVLADVLSNVHLLLMLMSSPYVMLEVRKTGYAMTPLRTRLAVAAIILLIAGIVSLAIVTRLDGHSQQPGDAGAVSGTLSVIHAGGTAGWPVAVAPVVQ
jgi:hypothetical protein